MRDYKINDILVEYATDEVIRRSINNLRTGGPYRLVGRLPPDPINAMLKRLDLELYIREKNLRAGL